MPVIRTASQAGYVTGGQRFRYVVTTVKVAPARSVLSYAEVVLGGAGVTPVTLAVKAGGGATAVGWSIGVPPFHMGGGTLTHVAPKAGDLVRLSLYYDQHGHVSATAVDTTRGTSQTVRLPVRAGTVYPAAEAAGVPGYTTAAPTGSTFRLWAFTGTHVTTAGGVRGTMLGPWVTSRIIQTTPRGAMVTWPSPLWSNGQNFGVWR